MFRHLLKIAAPIIAGQTLRAQINRQKQKVFAILLACLFFLCAAVFAIIALHALLLQNGFSEVAAAGMLAGVLALLGMICLAYLAYMKRSRESSHGVSRLIGDASTGPLQSLDRQAGQLVDQIGPMKLLALAFSIGVAASRGGRRD